jgi:hypothetical protein
MISAGFPVAPLFARNFQGNTSHMPRRGFTF